MIIQNITSQAVAPVEQSDSMVVATIAKASPAPGNAVEFAPIMSRKVSPDELKNAVSVINQAMRQSNSSLQFSVDTGTHTSIVRLVDTNTGELIRQIPSEETLAISRSIDELLQRQGLLFKQVA